MTTGTKFSSVSDDAGWAMAPALMVGLPVLLVVTAVLTVIGGLFGLVLYGPAMFHVMRGGRHGS